MGGVSLPSKEANLFKLIVKSYETKQYKKGLKAADAILKKFPDHGETLSMKGLTLNCMNRKSEAYELVRLGLKNDLRSHVCWHVYGLLYRSDREYREAIKCYRNALRIDPDNIEILRDLALLQAQMRDFEGFVETRQQLLMLKPNDRMNWIGFAVSQHLNFNGLKAVDILEAYERTLEDDYPPDNERFEDGEMLLYKISLLEECGLIERALEELRKKEFKIVDKLSYKEQEVTLLEKLGLFGDGEELYRKLLSMNPDNYRYYEGLQRCMGLYSAHGQYSSDDIDRLEALYASLSKLYSSSFAVKRIPLGFLNAEKFRLAAKNYILPFLTKGVSSLFSDLSSLYDDSAKAVILEQLILELEHSIKTTGGYPGRSEKEPPSTLMWILFYLAQHYDRLGQYDVSLRKIDEAIEHTPTLIDLYLVKSRILKHAGDSVAAAALADEARCMDLADRYVNSECVKRMLQADQVTLAEKTAVLFRKDGEQHNNLHDMQCMWYELAFGESYLRRGELGQALKKFLAVEKHYADITEDQFDFHSYCLRKMTLRTYVEMLKFQDRLHSYSYFRKAAAGAVKCYLKLYDSPPKSSAEEDEEMSKLPPSQKKKLRQKQRKAEARAKKEAEMKEESNATIVSKSGKRQVKPVDPDPHGEKLLEVEDPLAEATKYLKLLQKHSSDSLETHLLSFEVNMRKQKTLLALKAVKHLLRLDADNPDTHRCLIKFFHKVGSLPAPVSDAEKVIWGVLEAERPTFSQLQGNSLIEENSLFLEKHRVTEDETRVVLSQRTPVTTVTTGDLVAEFKSSLKLEEIEDDTSTVLAQKKEAPKEESADNSSPLKSTASGAGLGTPSTSKSSKGEGHSTGVVSKTTDGAPLNKGKTENEVKHMEDEPTSNSKSNPPTKSASPPASSKSGSASPSGPITEEETRVLLQRTPVTTGDLVAEFKSRLKLEEIEDDISPLIAPKKEAPKEETVDNSSPLKSTASGAGRGTPSTSKSLNRKRKRNNEESTGTDGAPLEKAKTQNEVKSVKDEPTSSTKSNAPTKCASPPASSKSGSAPLSGPVTEDEIRALLQGKPMTLWDFALKFYRRVTTERDKDAFGAILRRITRIQKTGASYKEDLVFLLEIEDDMSPVVAPKEEVPKEEPVDNSSFVKSSASGAGRGTPSTSKSSKGKSIKNGGESKTTNGPPLNKVKTENKIQEVKSVKDEPTASTKCNAPTRSASPPASSKSGSAPSAGPISEDEIRVLLQGTPKTVRDLVLPFESRLKTRRDQEAFMDLVIRITRKWKTGGADSKYVLFLREDR